MVIEREAAEQTEAERDALLLKHYTQRAGRLVDPIQAKSDAAWRISAYRAHLRIVAKCQGSQYSG